MEGSTIRAQVPISIIRAHAGSRQAPASTIQGPEGVIQGPLGFDDDNGALVERYNALIEQEEESRLVVALAASIRDEEELQRDLASYAESIRFAEGHQERLEEDARRLRGFSSGASN